MRGQILENVVMFSRNYLKNFIKEGWVCIDATLGHGKDLLFLSDLVGQAGFVYGFDIQDEAIKSSQKIMSNQATYSNYQLIHCSHEYMDQKLEGPVNFIIFNLGYLPKGNKMISTQKESTLVSVKKGLGLLSKNGLLWIVIYPGHACGAEEALALEAYCKDLNQNEYSVMKLNIINQINNPPYIIAIEKKF